MASTRERVIAAVASLVAAALPTAVVERNQAKAERIEAGGLVIVRDGDPGEPEIELSPLAYLYTHRIPIEFAVAAGVAGGPESALDAMLASLGAAVLADRTLGGLCDYIDVEAPQTDALDAAGAAAGRSAELAIVASYATADPLN